MEWLYDNERPGTHETSRLADRTTEEINMPGRTISPEFGFWFEYIPLQMFRILNRPILTSQNPPSLPSLISIMFSVNVIIRFYSFLHLIPSLRIVRDLHKVIKERGGLD